MDLIHIIVLSIIQGLTEFLPVSSSAHLILLSWIAGWQDQGLALDVAAHFASACAALIYFRKDVARILNAGFISVAQRECNTVDAKLFWHIVIASIPVLLAGWLAREIITAHLRDPLIIASASIGFGLLLWFADIKGSRSRSIATITMRDAIIIGLAQAVALLPGTSRSGFTITVALMLGLDRISAARFSFLLAIPVILVAATYEFFILIQSGNTVDMMDFLITAGLSFITAILTIHYFLRFIEQIGMLPFVIYRVILGGALFIVFL